MLYNCHTRIKEEYDVKWPLWAFVYTCLKIVQATIIMATLHRLGLSNSEEPFIWAPERIDSKLFSLLNPGPAKEVGTLLSQILSSLLVLLKGYQLSLLFSCYHKWCYT